MWRNGTGNAHSLDPKLCSRRVSTGRVVSAGIDPIVLLLGRSDGARSISGCATLPAEHVEVDDRKSSRLKSWLPSPLSRAAEASSSNRRVPSALPQPVCLPIHSARPAARYTPRSCKNPAVLRAGLPVVCPGLYSPFCIPECRPHGTTPCTGPWLRDIVPATLVAARSTTERTTKQHSWPSAKAARYVFDYDDETISELEQAIARASGIEPRGGDS